MRQPTSRRRGRDSPFRSVLPYRRAWSSAVYRCHSVSRRLLYLVQDVRCITPTRHLHVLLYHDPRMDRGVGRSSQEFSARKSPRLSGPKWGGSSGSVEGVSFPIHSALLGGRYQKLETSTSHQLQRYMSIELQPLSSPLHTHDIVLKLFPQRKFLDISQLPVSLDRGARSCQSCHHPAGSPARSRVDQRTGLGFRAGDVW